MYGNAHGQLMFTCCCPRSGWPSRLLPVTFVHVAAGWPTHAAGVVALLVLDRRAATSRAAGAASTWVLFCVVRASVLPSPFRSACGDEATASLTGCVRGQRLAQHPGLADREERCGARSSRWPCPALRRFSTPRRTRPLGQLRGAGHARGQAPTAPGSCPCRPACSARVIGTASWLPFGVLITCDFAVLRLRRALAAAGSASRPARQAMRRWSVREIGNGFLLVWPLPGIGQVQA